MKLVDLPKVRLWERVADKFMVPIMFALRGFRTDSLQETHTWHPYRISVDKLDFKLAVESHGKDKSKFKFGSLTLFLFHAPILGGWRDFSVYEVDQTSTPFHIGWVVYRSSDNKLLNASVQRLPIQANRIRMLDGPTTSWGYFFAVNSKGEQISLKKIGQGRVGDGAYTDIRLF
jgi:hypothetical protein